MLKNLIKIFFVILFFNISTCYANENYINTNLFKEGNRVDLNIFVNGDIDIYGFLGKINYDKNVLTLKECRSDKYTVSVENDILLLESITPQQNTVIATCEFNSIEDISYIYFNVTDISLSNSTNVIYNIDSSVNREIENNIIIQEEIENNDTKTNNNTKKNTIVIPIIAVIILCGTLFLRKKYQLLVFIAISIIIATSLTTYAINQYDDTTTEEKLNELRNMLLNKISFNNIKRYDYDNDLNLTINDLILGLIDLNNINNAPEENNQEPTPTPTIPEENNQEPTPTPTIPEENNQEPTPTPTIPEENNQEPTPTPTIPEENNQEPTPTPTIPEKVVDTTAPVINYCQTVIRDKKTYFYVDSKDTDIAKYVVNNNSSLTFTNSTGTAPGNFTVNSEIKNAKVTVYDTSNNSSTITCWWYYDQIKPPENAKILRQEETDTLKVIIQDNANSGQDFYTTYIWVKDAYSQFKTEVPSNYGTNLDYPEELLQSAVNKYKLKNKLAVGINASGFEGANKAPYYNAPAIPYVVSNGTVIRDFTNRTDLGTPKYNTYGLNKNKLLKHYSYSGRTLPELAQAIRNDGVKNTFGWIVNVLVKDGKRATNSKETVTQQGICQINENNFIFISFKYSSHSNFADYMINLGCKTGFSLDGGGSVQLVYKSPNANVEKLQPKELNKFHRAIPDIIFFHQ